MLFALCALLLVWAIADNHVSQRRRRAAALEARVAARLWRSA
jgi:hypothetical protein